MNSITILPQEGLHCKGIPRVAVEGMRKREKCVRKTQHFQKLNQGLNLRTT